MKIDTTSSTYYNKIPIIGIVPMLMMLRMFEQEEAYIECAKITKAINRWNADVGDDLLTKIDDDTILNYIVGAEDKLAKLGEREPNYPWRFDYYMDLAIKETIVLAHPE